MACRQDLIRALLTREPAARLGSAACGGAQRIFAHPFFEGLPWEGLLQGAPGPPVPHVHACLAGINSVLLAQGLHLRRRSPHLLAELDHQEDGD
jgi:hypothetical protein